MSITPEKKREQCISNALYLYTLGRSDWFYEVDDKICRDLVEYPKHKDRTLLKWLRSCERIECNTVKQKILDRYNKLPVSRWIGYSKSQKG